MVMKKKNDEVNWNDVWEQWKCLWNYYPYLNKKQECNNILIPNENCPPGNFVQGIDWIESYNYEKRIDKAVNHTIEFLLFSESKNKGTLTTARNIMKSIEEPELTAGIWIYATTFDFIESLPENWYGDTYRLIEKVNNAAFFYIKDKVDYNWHHAMRSLVPEVFFTYSFKNDFIPTSLKSILEIIAINTLLVTSSYKIVYYMTAGHEPE